MSDLKHQSCKPCEAGTPPLARSEAERLLAQVPGWTLDEAKRWLAPQIGHAPDP